MEVKRLGNYNGFTGGSYSGNVYDKWGIAPTLNTMRGGNTQPMIVDDKQYRIRKLTPRECYRLMGFSDSDFDKAAAVNSNTQLYKQAGNSIVVNVLEAIFRELFKSNEEMMVGSSKWLDKLLSE